MDQFPQENLGPRSLLVNVVTVVVFVLCLFWLVTEPGFEALVATVTTGLVTLGRFVKLNNPIHQMWFERIAVGVLIFGVVIVAYLLINSNEVELGGLDIDRYCKREYGGTNITAEWMPSSGPPSEIFTGIFCRVRTINQNGEIEDEVHQPVSFVTLTELCQSTYNLPGAYVKLSGNTSSDWKCYIKR